MPTTQIVFYACGSYLHEAIGHRECLVWCKRPPISPFSKAGLVHLDLRKTPQGRIDASSTDWDAVEVDDHRDQGGFSTLGQFHASAANGAAYTDVRIAAGAYLAYPKWKR